ncbi:ACP phosphodiesterase [Aestuariirhabdus sp. Z084]|uniref:acyl carrier protein phosphodiesterase n=1 Tax=Aestuariirhabdus haliotis TaxID=2918751 RepID=UPI00201B35CC|nr:ACP phosphodiesterase [Aestuariirhabdus haliotis]MCL6414381.1 ACP phosphodiesterase [Aestuariirhabdus haliotis]MCL6418313.1 ACP phosphodiesterase [Aestuariirhabdus haliotis]
MNYLAHLALAGSRQQHRIGGFLGDFVKGPLQGRFAPDIEVGIRQHRAIDAHTDRDPAITHCRLMLGTQHRRYSGIAIDILFDHFLARHWCRFYQQAFDHFCEACYQDLQTHQHLMPANAQQFVERMQQHRILHSYYHRKTVSLAIERTAQRLRHGAPLLNTIPALENAYPELEQAFIALYPELQIRASNLLNLSP